MTSEQISAVVDAIRSGALSADSPLSLLEFQAINQARLERDKAIRDQLMESKGTVGGIQR